jgi:DNA polymerase III subunit beta
VKFTAEARAMRDALGSIKGCIITSKTVPILQHILFKTIGRDSIAVTGYHVEREAQNYFKAQVESDGAFTARGDMLYTITRNFTDSAVITFEHDVKLSTLEISAGSSLFTMRTLPAKDFPSLVRNEAEHITSFKVPADALRELLKMTMYPCDKDATARPWVRGVYLHIDNGKLASVASDDHRMAKHTVKLPEGAADMEGFIYPSESAKELVRVMPQEGMIEIEVSKSRIDAKWGMFRLSSRTVDTTFPGYINHIGVNYAPTMDVHPTALFEAVRRVEVVKKTLDDSFYPAIFSLEDGRCTLSMGRLDRDMAKEEIEANVHHKENLVFKLQGRYLNELLAAWPEDAEMEVQYEVGRPIVFCSKKRPELRHLIMPVLK